MTDKAYAKTFGAGLRDRRKALGISQAELAAAIGVTGATISNWESGRTSLRAFDEKRLRRYFKWAKAAEQVAQ